MEQDGRSNGQASLESLGFPLPVSHRKQAFSHFKSISLEISIHLRRPALFSANSKFGLYQLLLVMWIKRNFAWVSKPSSSFRTADAVHEALAKASRIGDLIQLHMALALFSVVDGKLVNTAGKLALSFMISDTAVLFKPFWFQHSLTRICIPCLILLVQSMLMCKRKIILWFWHCLSQPYLACLVFSQCLDTRFVRGVRSGLYRWSPVNSKGWREDSVHVIFSTVCLRKASEDSCFPSVFKELRISSTLGAWLVSWSHPLVPLFLTCPFV